MKKLTNSQLKILSDREIISSFRWVWVAIILLFLMIMWIAMLNIQDLQDAVYENRRKEEKDVEAIRQDLDRHKHRYSTGLPEYNPRW